jgi:5-methylcytosine-specific restriction endonuclease McrA
VNRGRIRNREAGRDKLFLERKCRLCPRRIRDGLTRHHLVPRASPFLGDDVDDNLMPLCLPCHDKEKLGDGETRQAIRHAMTGDETAYVLQKMGLEWLNRRYPL